MTTQETNRAQLRAFKDAARDIQAHGSARLAYDDYVCACYSATTVGYSRRQRVNDRSYAHALATAWGL